jgi:uncharacterized protein YbbC (DUF1343 family)
MDGARVKVGLERLLTEAPWRKLVEGRRVAILANPISVDHRFKHVVDLATDAGWDLVRLFGPEHGIRGEAQDMESVEQTLDPITGLPCVSLYGKDEASLRPRAEHLDGVDALVIDLQDVGARYYTFVYTAAWAAQVCAQTGTQVILCDRPNPLGGEVLEGNLVQEGFRSFVGAWPLPTRHGMTMGELLRCFDARGDLRGCDLQVVPMEGWRRSMWYDQTGLAFVQPSPNMPTLDTATVYPGMCLLEGTNLSEGRGTTRPFELFGAPWLDARALLERLDTYQIPGCAFRLATFKPMFQKHAGQLCKGLQLHVTDRASFRSLTTALILLQETMALHPDEFAWRTQVYEFVQDRLAIDLLLGDGLMRQGLYGQMGFEEWEGLLAQSRASFEAERAASLLY